MKKTTTLILTLLSFALWHDSFAAEYIFDAQTADWFSTRDHIPAWEKAPNNEAFIGFASETNFIRISNINTNWKVPVTTYGGGIWTAPVGEVITRVEFIFDGVYGVAGAPQLAVFGGTNTPSLQLHTTDLKGDFRNKNQNASVACEPTETIRVIQIRNWHCAVPATLQPKWFSRVSRVVITTVPATK